MAQAFKMACLAQQENQIFFKFQKFERKDLLKTRDVFITKARDIAFPENPNKGEITLPIDIQESSVKEKVMSNH